MPITKAPAVKAVRIMSAVDESPDLSWLEDESRYKGEPPRMVAKYLAQDQERLRTYGDQWWMIGIWAEADVVVDGVIQKIRSGGLWGIESDSDKSYFQEVAGEEYRALVDILKQIGVRRIPPFKDAEWKDR
jgi:hypothetical protein